LTILRPVVLPDRLLRVVLDLVKRAGVKYSVHYCNTTIDPPEVLKHIRRYHPEAKILRSERSYWQWIMYAPRGNPKGLPTPWRLDERPTGELVLLDTGERIIGQWCRPYREDVLLILHAVNSHAALEKIAEAAMEYYRVAQRLIYEMKGHCVDNCAYCKDVAISGLTFIDAFVELERQKGVPK